MKGYIALALVFFCVSIILAGCGETFHGVSKDASRIGKGAHTIIFRDE